MSIIQTLFHRDGKQLFPGTGGSSCTQAPMSAGFGTIGRDASDRKVCLCASLLPGIRLGQHFRGQRLVKTQRRFGFGFWLKLTVILGLLALVWFNLDVLWKTLDKDWAEFKRQVSEGEAF